MKSFKQYISEVVATQYGHTLWIDPKGKVYDMGNSYTHHEWASKNWKKFSKTEPDHEDMWDLPYEQNWVRVKVGRSVIDIEAAPKKINRKQKSTIEDIYYSRGNTKLKIYIDAWEKNKTSRSGDKMYRDSDEADRFFREEYITEKPAKLSSMLAYKGAKWNEFRGLENPNEQEMLALMKKSHFKELRFVVDNKGKMWAWDTDDSLHEPVVYAMTGKKYDGDYAKGMINFLRPEDLDDLDPDTEAVGNLHVIILNSRIGTKFALKNRTLKALAKRINATGKDRVWWKDT